VSPKEEVQIIQDTIKSINDQAKKAGFPQSQSEVDHLIKLEARLKELTDKMITSVTKPDYLPEDLIELLDEAIQCVCSNQELPPAIDELYDWFEDEGLDHLLTIEATLPFALSLGDILQSFADDEVADDNEVAVDAVTDLMRVAYARREIEEALESFGYMHSVYCAEVKGSTDKIAFLACTVEEQGQHGTGISWWGIYKNTNDFVDAIRKSDCYVLEDEVEALSNEKILSLLNTI